jgi:hypothetical protein
LFVVVVVKVSAYSSIALHVLLLFRAALLFLLVALLLILFRAALFFLPVALLLLLLFYVKIFVRR